MKPKYKYQRSSGVLLPVTALHGPYGVGVLGKEAREFIDFLCEAQFTIWQVLPVEQVGSCFSPYKCISTYAGEPILIDPRALWEMGLVASKDLEERSDGLCEGNADFALVREKQWTLLRTAFSNLKGEPYVEYNPPWLENYALYMALKTRYEDKPWFQWPDADVRAFDAAAVALAKKELAEDIKFYKFVQWLFSVQWTGLKEYATSRGISIMGDLPIYVSEDSVDVWSRRELFDADTEGVFLKIGGAPPDYFNLDGQLWGNPIYNWELLEKEGFSWWIDRVRASLGRYDLLRLDNFRGLESYWSNPADAKTAREGKWVKGPGMKLINALTGALGELPIVAEDLGDVTVAVVELLRESGFRGMRVLQFGFGYLPDEMHVPHSFTENCIAYTGTHDNTTMLAWLFDLGYEEREQVLFYYGFNGDWTAGGPNCAIMKCIIRGLFTSAASITIVPIQDLLGYGADTRTNVPGSAEGNWAFRMRTGVLSEIDAGFYRALNKATGRTIEPEPEVEPEVEAEPEVQVTGCSENT